MSLANRPISRIASKSLISTVLLLMLLLSSATAYGDRQVRPAAFQKAAIIQFYGPIDYKLFKYFQSRISQAEKAGVDLLIVDINSPGGLLEESLKIAKKLRDVKWAYTVAFVEKEAISGAALVALGCDEIIVANDSIYGDIGAIYMEADGAFRYIPAKMNSFLVRDTGELAKSKNRSPELVEAMIDKDVMVYWKPNGGGKTYKTVRVGDPAPGEPWKLIEESGKERFLTVNGTRLKELGMAQHIAADRKELAANLHYEESKAREFRYTGTDTVVYYLNLPFITGCLVVFGLIALYIELSAPGIGVGGLIAGLCACLFFWSRFMGGTSTWLEVMLFAAGVVFLAFELFVIPGWGISGLLGLLLLTASIVMASQDFVMPSNGDQWNQVVTTLLMLMCSGAVVLIIGAFLAQKLGTLPMFNKMVLAPSVDEKDPKETSAKPDPPIHPDVSLGDWGVSESLLRPAGRAKFHGRSFDVVSDGSFIEPDARIKVVNINGNRIVVAQVDDMDETTYRS